jgi:hypothetical protein
MKKRKKKKWRRKKDKCPRYKKQWVHRCPPEKKREKKKREMNKIAHVFLQSCFQVLKRDIFSRSIVELSQPTYMSTIHLYTCTS